MCSEPGLVCDYCGREVCWENEWDIRFRSSKKQFESELICIWCENEETKRKRKKNNKKVS